MHVQLITLGDQEGAGRLLLKACETAGMLQPAFRTFHRQPVAPLTLKTPSNTAPALHRLLSVRTVKWAQHTRSSALTSLHRN